MYNRYKSCNEITGNIYSFMQLHFLNLIRKRYILIFETFSM